MKKLFISVMMLLFAGSLTFANNADLFNLDYNSVKAEFSELNQLGEMVMANESLTYSQLLATNGNLISEMNLVSEGAIPQGGEKNPVLGIPSFLWGCGLGVVGMLVVYIVSDKDKVETKKAMWGCLTWTGISVVATVVYYVAIVGAVSTI